MVLAFKTRRERGRRKERERGGGGRGRRRRGPLDATEVAALLPSLVEARRAEGWKKSERRLPEAFEGLARPLRCFSGWWKV